MSGFGELSYRNVEDRDENEPSNAEWNWRTLYEVTMTHQLSHNLHIVSY